MLTFPMYQTLAVSKTLQLWGFGALNQTADQRQRPRRFVALSMHAASVGVETADISAVLDGELGPFITAYLRWCASSRQAKASEGTPEG